MSQQDSLLCQLIREVLQLEVESPERNRKIEHLLALIPLLPGIIQKHKLSDGFRSCYEAAFTVTLNDIGRKISNFPAWSHLDMDSVNSVDLRKRFVQWVNMILWYDIHDEYRKRQRPRRRNNHLSPPISLDTRIKGKAGDETQTTLGDILPDPKTLGDLDSWIERKEHDKTRLKANILELYIERDPNGRLQGCYHTDQSGNECRSCNCQLLFKELYLTLETEKKIRIPDIARRYNIPQQTIYTRLLPKCRKLLRQIQQDIENNFDEYVKQLLGD